MSATPYTDLMEKLSAADTAGTDPLPMTPEEKALLSHITRQHAIRHYRRLYSHYSAEATEREAVLLRGEALMLGAFFLKKFWKHAIRWADKMAPRDAMSREDSIRGFLWISLEREMTSYPELRKAERDQKKGRVRPLGDVEMELGSKEGVISPVPDGVREALVTEPSDDLEPAFVSALPAEWVALVARKTTEPLVPPPPAEPRPSSNGARVALEYVPWAGQPVTRGGVLDQVTWAAAGGVPNNRTSELLRVRPPGKVTSWLREFRMADEQQVPARPPIFERDFPRVLNAMRRALFPWKPEIVLAGGLLAPDATLTTDAH